MDASVYDEVRYPGRPFPQTHPDRLATLGALFGLRPPDPAGCRVLELGCGDGANLLPMAIALPAASFVGIDSATGAIARAAATAQELGLDNVRFAACSIEDYEPPAGGFDYVVAHGVYSWVPAAVRERLLAVSARALSPEGVTYVSYNALPGGRLRQSLRDLLAFHLDGVEDPAGRIAGARGLLELLRDARLGGEGDELAISLGEAAGALLERPLEALFHDELAPVNDPFYFHEFVVQAAVHGLQYLAEADFSDMQTGPMPESIVRELLPVDDRLRHEQYLDFVKGRAFRQTLLCHEGRRVDHVPRSERLLELWVSTPDEASAADVLGPVAAAWPGAVAIAELVGDDTSPAERELLCESLLLCYATDIVALHAYPPALCTAPGERPRVSALARLQARGEGEFVTNLRHGSVRLQDELVRRLVTLLDGTRDRAALIEQLGHPDDVPPEVLAAGLERSLEALARLALLDA
jgi:SAM-dependent methyltransferase